MPIYEYRCQKCHRRVSILVRGSNESRLSCPRCGSTELNRLFSTFSIRGKSDQDIYEDILSDKKLVGGLEKNDPKALAEWNKKISRGEGVSPEFDEMVENMQSEKAGEDTSSEDL